MGLHGLHTARAMPQCGRRFMVRSRERGYCGHLKPVFMSWADTGGAGGRRLQLIGA